MVVQCFMSLSYFVQYVQISFLQNTEMENDLQKFTLCITKKKSTTIWYPSSNVLNFLIVCCMNISMCKIHAPIFATMERYQADYFPVTTFSMLHCIYVIYVKLHYRAINDPCNRSECPVIAQNIIFGSKTSNLIFECSNKSLLIDRVPTHNRAC